MKLPDNTNKWDILSYTAWYMHLTLKLLLFCFYFVIVILSTLLPLLALDLTAGSDVGFQFRLQLESHNAPASREDVRKGLVNSQSRKVLGGKRKAESYLFF